MDQSDSWKVLEYFVAGLRSDADFTTKVRITLGGQESGACKDARETMRTQKVCDKKRNRSDRDQSQCTASNFVKLSKIKNQPTKGAHKTEILSLKDNCKVSATTVSKKHTVRMAERKCGNCAWVGHQKNECPDPDYATTSKSKTTLKGEIEIVEIVFDMFGVNK
eukprot:scaffold36993_cov59-Attheya_sp.AAC.2